MKKDLLAYFLAAILAFVLTQQRGAAGSEGPITGSGNGAASCTSAGDSAARLFGTN